MTENNMPEGAPTEEIPAALSNVDRAELDKLKAAVKKIVQSEKKTVSGSEAPDAVATPEEGLVTHGKDVDWSEYELSFPHRHFYPHAEFRETGQGPKWVVMVDDFYSTERDFKGHDAEKLTDGTRRNLGEYLNSTLNSGEGWRLVSLLPGGLGRAGLLLQRQIPIVLPDPVKLKKGVEVEPPRDPELQQVEDAGLKFAEDIGVVTEKLRPALEQLALELNAPTERVPGQGEKEEPIAPAAGTAAESALAGDDFEKRVTEDGRVEG